MRVAVVEEVIKVLDQRPLQAGAAHVTKYSENEALAFRCPQHFPNNHRRPECGHQYATARSNNFPRTTPAGTNGNSFNSFHKSKRRYFTA